jgi:hypothetical protein
MSCDSEDLETCEVWRKKMTRARKEHGCDCCTDPIRRGDLYSYTFYILDGDASTMKRCLRCETLYQRLVKLHERHGTGEAVDPELNCGHSFDEVFGEPAPDELARLAFMTPAEIQAEFGKAAL